MDAFVTALTLKALDGLYTRATVTSDNIANAGTRGFRPRVVTFEKALSAAAERGLASVQEVRPSIERQPIGAQEPDLRLDLELATASSTALRYSALIETLNRELDLQALATKGNS